MGGIYHQPGGCGPPPHLRAPLTNIFLNPSVLYHPGQDNRIADDASRLFDISDTPFLAHMSATYPQTQILWHLCPPSAAAAFMRDIHAAKEAV